MNNLLYLLFSVLIILNIYIIFNQHLLLYKNNITPLFSSSNFHSFSKGDISEDTSPPSFCQKPSIISDIKQYYKNNAISNNDFTSEIDKILKINLVQDDSINALYCDVLYTLNNNNEGNRRFGITNSGVVISMGKPNTGLTVQ